MCLPLRMTISFLSTLTEVFLLIIATALLPQKLSKSCPKRCFCGLPLRSSCSSDCRNHVQEPGPVILLPKGSGSATWGGAVGERGVGDRAIQSCPGTNNGLHGPATDPGLPAKPFPRHKTPNFRRIELCKPLDKEAWFGSCTATKNPTAEALTSHTP